MEVEKYFQQAPEPLNVFVVCHGEHGQEQVQEVGETQRLPKVGFLVWCSITLRKTTKIKRKKNTANIIHLARISKRQAYTIFLHPVAIN